MDTGAFVVCHDRYELLKYWLQLWPKLDPGMPLTVVHPYDNGPHPEVYETFIRHGSARVSFHVRPNQGADIGSFKALLDAGKVPEIICWFTDDCLPMRQDFLSYFLNPFYDSAAVGLVAFAFEPQSAGNRHTHARTVAFAVRREVALHFKWPDRITTCTGADRGPCFEFEHGPQNMYRQVLAMGYQVRACYGSPPETEGYAHWVNSPWLMWDSGHTRHFDRWADFRRVHGLEDAAS